MTHSPLIGRRQAVAGLSATVIAAFGAARVLAQPGSTTAARACVLTPQAIEGPFYFDPDLVRTDITEGMRGIPLSLSFKVSEVGPCAALANARVDIWHSDPVGEYSGYFRQSDTRDVSTKGKTFLRGTQMTDKNGDVAFRTVYPGWYLGRTPHIHVKVFLDRRNILTSQFYFPEDLNERLFRQNAPYNQRKAVQDTHNGNDFLFQLEGGNSAIFDIADAGGAYHAAMNIGIDRKNAA